MKKIVVFALAIAIFPAVAAAQPGPGPGPVPNVWTQNGTNIYSANSGNVGIGTGSPTGKLEVKPGAGAPAINVDGSTSGKISIVPQAAAGTYNLNLPTSAGTANQALFSGGGGSAPMTWSSASKVVATIAALQAITSPVSGQAIQVTDVQGAGSTFTWVVGALPCDAFAGGGDGGTTFCTSNGSGGYATSGYWQRRFTGPISVTWFGAVGDGSADDTAEQNAALASPAALNNAVYWPATGNCYKSTSALNVAQATTIYGGGTLCQYTTGTNLLRVTASNVTIDGSFGLTLKGMAQAWPATDVAGEMAINVGGTFNPGAPPTYINNIVIRNLRINDWGQYAVYAEYVDGLRQTGNVITNVTDSGTQYISVQHFTYADNQTYNITGNGTNVDNEAYGIAISRRTTDAGNLTSQPASCDGTVSNNLFKDIPTWNAIDTHSGCRISFVGNNVYNAKRGYAIGASVNNTGGVNYTFPPVDITVTGGTLDSGVINGTREEGISFTGASASGLPATGSITGVTMRGFGNQASATSGAIVLANTQGVTVAGNPIYYPGSAGVSANSTNVDLNLVGNTIIDPWSNTAPVVGVRTVGNNNGVNFASNTIKHVDKSATYLLTSASGAGIRISTGTGNSARAVGNKIFATNAIVDVPGVLTAQVVANGVTPVVVPNTSITDLSIVSVTPIPGSTGKGAFHCNNVPGVSFSVCSFAGDATTYNWQVQQ